MVSEISGINWKGFSPGELQKHWVKHQGEFSFSSPSEYLNAAKELASQTVGNYRAAKISNIYIKVQESQVLIMNVKNREIRSFVSV